jgi:uncharacterized protein YciI
MLILSLTYIVPVEQADAHMQAHMAWVKNGYAKGWFVASGRKIPRTGGVVLARGDRTELEAYCATDPFTLHGIAVYDITEVAFTTVIDDFASLKHPG